MTVVTNEQPYATGWQHYAAAGWAPFPMPAGDKFPPPKGRTGREGIDADRQTLERWATTHGGGNLGVRCPDDVIGIDVDDYNSKTGGKTMTDLARQYGPLPPTKMSTSRPGTGSGIKWFKVPPGRIWISGWDDVDVIQHGYRYACVWPSRHPEGRTYMWIDEATGLPCDVPDVDDLPELPKSWIYAAEQRDGVIAEKAGLDTAGLTDIRRSLPMGTPCEDVIRFAEKRRQPGSRHDAYKDAVLAIVGAGRRGCPGVSTTLDAIGVEYVAAISDRLPRDAAEREWQRMVDGALDIVALDPQRDECPAAQRALVDEYVGGLEERPLQGPPPPDYHDDDGILKVDVIDEQFPIIDWAVLWADESTERWYAEPLIAEGRLTAIYSPPKVGKSLLMLEIAAAVACGRSLFGYGDPGEAAVVLYVDFENDPRGDIRTRLQAMGYGPDDLGLLRYLSFPSLSALDTERGALQLMAIAERHGAKVIVIDTVSRAVEGEENDNDTWLAFYRHTGLKVKQRKLSLVRLDHTGKDITKGQRGGSAKSGDVDAVWRLSAVDVERGIYELECEARRFQFSETKMTLVREQSPHLMHRVDASAKADAWREKVDKATECLNSLGIPSTLGYQKAYALTKPHGCTEAATKQAQIERKLRETQDEMGLS